MKDIERRIADFLREEADRATLPTTMHESVLRRGKVRRMTTLGLTVLSLVGIVTAGSVAGSTLRSPSPIAPASSGQPPEPSPTSRTVDGCPVTLPGEPAFVPPSPYPSRFPNPNVPESDESQWYGTPELWTTLPAEGHIWEDLPKDDGMYADRTLWWSNTYPPGGAPSGTITLTGRRIDDKGSFETGGPAGGGYREDTYTFIILGFEIPVGCWELTAKYKGAELSYVALVRD